MEITNFATIITTALPWFLAYFCLPISLVVMVVAFVKNEIR